MSVKNRSKLASIRPVKDPTPNLTHKSTKAGARSESSVEQDVNLPLNHFLPPLPSGHNPGLGAAGGLS